MGLDKGQVNSGQSASPLFNTRFCGGFIISAASWCGSNGVLSAAWVGFRAGLVDRRQPFRPVAIVGDAGCGRDGDLRS